MSRERRAAVFLHSVVQPTLKAMGGVQPRMNSLEAEQIVMTTAWHESGGLKHFVQVRGPALSPFQVELPTHDWLRDHYHLDPGAEQSDLGRMIESLMWPLPLAAQDQLACNWQYACAMARLRFWFDRHALPEPFDWPGQARYWKRVFNSVKGKGTVAKFLRSTREIRSLWPVS